MFAQVIQGRVAKPAVLRELLDRWVDELSPGATGWLGSTVGVTDDGRLIGIARFESEALARRNSERPEQHEWWTEASKLLRGEAVFHDCADFTQLLRGGSDDATFVQMIQGRVLDVDLVHAVLDRSEPMLTEFRPDLIGVTFALHGDGGFTEAAYFTSEAEARAGERKEPSGEMKDLFEQERALLTQLEYFDLRDPWLYSPRV
ncbi:MAG: hypothetical protein ACRDPK_16100 [Carbonactinosporaceae bacterium]